MPASLHDAEAGALALAQLIRKAGGPVFFLSGAGMSTEGASTPR